MNKIQVVALVCILLSAVTGLARTRGAESPLASDPLYKKDCAKCHGKNATGRHFGGPSLVSAKVANASAEDLRSMIANGKGRMPKFQGKLAPAQIDELVQQIVSGHK